MKAHAAYLLLKVRESFWFVPLLIVAGAFGLSHAALYVDAATIAGDVARRVWFGALDDESARVILSTVTGAMITTASLVFSLTLVSLTLASQQLGPRLLTLFLRDRITQTVLGLFLATFVYALIVLMALGGDEGPREMPMLAISIAVMSTMASFVALIVFIHHLSTSLQADVVVSRVALQLREQIEAHCPVVDPDAPDSDEAAPLPEIAGRTVDATGNGYIQAVDHDALVAIAAAHECRIRVLRRPGHFLARGEPLAVVDRTDVDPQEYADALHKAVVFGEKRTAAQDLEFSLMAIVEIALRALSPGINDPHTANTCVDRLSEGLTMIAARRLRPRSHCDDSGDLRLVTDEVTFHGLVDTAFDEIRQYATGSVSVMVRLGEALARIADEVRTAEQAAAVRRHVERLERSVSANVREPADLAAIEAVLENVRVRLAAAPVHG